MAENEVTQNRREVLCNLQKKITMAEAEVAKTQGAVSELQEEIKSRLKTDAIGASLYEPEELRKDRQELVKRERAKDFAVETLATLEAVLPEVQLAAAREELGGIDADLTLFDSETLTPALSRFRQMWNEMLAVLQETQQVYKARDAMLGRFKALVKELPSEEQAVTHPSLPFWLRPSFTTVLEKAGVQELRPLREVDFEKRARESWPVEVPESAPRPSDPVNKLSA